MKSRRAKTSIMGSWSRNLYDIVRKIEVYHTLIKRADFEKSILFRRKIDNLVRNANSLALKLGRLERIGD